MIVNPWLFYLMNVCSSAKVVTVLLMIVSAAGALFLGVTLMVAKLDEVDEDIVTVVKRPLTLSCWIFAISTLAVMFIPSKDTLLMMQAARLATTDNVELVFESLKSAMDYAVQLLK